MKKSVIACLLTFVCIVFVGCGRENVANKSMVEDFTEKFGDDYLEYATVEKADDYFKQCFERIEGDWYADDMKIDFYIDDDMYMMSGWTERARVIAFIDPIRNHENQFEIGLEAGELQEILRCEIIEENKEILIEDTLYVRTEDIR